MTLLEEFYSSYMGSYCPNDLNKQKRSKFQGHSQAPWSTMSSLPEMIHKRWPKLCCVEPTPVDCPLLDLIQGDLPVRDLKAAQPKRQDEQSDH